MTEVVKRHVSTSEMTTIVAKGILLYARVQNMSNSDAQHSGAYQEWGQWKTTYPEWVEFVKKEQFDLFDRINNYRS